MFVIFKLQKEHNLVFTHLFILYDTLCSFCMLSIYTWAFVSFTVFVYGSFEAALRPTCVYSVDRCISFVSFRTIRLPFSNIALKSIYMKKIGSKQATFDIGWWP